MRSILMTGRPGVGKSTLVEQVLQVLPASIRVAGMLSGELREDGRRQGFTVRAIGGASGILASPNLPGEPRFGSKLPDGNRRLGLSLRHLEEDVCPKVAGSLPADLVALDEIGPMQVSSSTFRALVHQILDSEVPLLASIALEPHAWLDQLKHDNRLSLLELTPRNRDVVREMLSAYVLRELEP